MKTTQKNLKHNKTDMIQAKTSGNTESIPKINRPNEEKSSPPTTKIPPIILQKKEAWEKISTEFRNKNINYSHVKNTDDGIKIQLTDIDSYRKATKFLRQRNLNFFTFTAQEDKSLRVVIQGIPEYFSGDVVKEDLLEKSFHPESVLRMHRNRKP